MAQVQAQAPGAKLGIGPAVADGFYYDFDLARPLTPDDLEAIEARMRASVAEDHAFVRKEVAFDDGRSVVEGAGQSYKVEILDDLAAHAIAALVERTGASAVTLKASGHDYLRLIDENVSTLASALKRVPAR